MTTRTVVLKSCFIKSEMHQTRRRKYLFYINRRIKPKCRKRGVCITGRRVTADTAQNTCNNYSYKHANTQHPPGEGAASARQSWLYGQVMLCLKSQSAAVPRRNRTLL
ncbi:hypothetical protein JOB18_009898 [Solea senegalensis]|uniref:Uncharacterized protein n=1 Tax=Solea senegalensis TaxID=28829 RepID=A0AAV6RCE9_SOLSE|nr:hypothetical protein JOB18_009898 [Solea senegalensis]